MIGLIGPRARLVQNPARGRLSTAVAQGAPTTHMPQPITATPALRRGRTPTPPNVPREMNASTRPSSGRANEAPDGSRNVSRFFAKRVSRKDGCAAVTVSAASVASGPPRRCVLWRRRHRSASCAEKKNGETAMSEGCAVWYNGVLLKKTAGDLTAAAHPIARGAECDHFLL